MKFISTLLLITLCSCSAFSDTPDAVLEGQRGVYRGVTILQQNYQDLLLKYERDMKAAVIYHINYTFERQIIDATDNSALVEELEQSRKDQVAKAIEQIDETVKELKNTPIRNAEVVKILTETIYNYLSTSPIKFDDINYWIKELDEATADDR